MVEVGDGPLNLAAIRPGVLVLSSESAVRASCSDIIAWRFMGLELRGERLALAMPNVNAQGPEVLARLLRTQQA